MVVCCSDIIEECVAVISLRRERETKHSVPLLYLGSVVDNV